MKPTKILPPSYTHYRTLDLSTNIRLMIVLNVIGLGLFFLSGWFFIRIAIALRPDGSLAISGSGVWLGLLTLLAAYILVVVLHEAVHGLFFWIFTRERPRFALKHFYAYAAAPDWYLPRNPYLLVGLSPLLVITLAGIAFIPWVPSGDLIYLLFVLAANASGAIGDLYTVAWLLTLPPTILVRDCGDLFMVYRRGNE